MRIHLTLFGASMSQLGSGEINLRIVPPTAALVRLTFAIGNGFDLSSGWIHRTMHFSTSPVHQTLKINQPLFESDQPLFVVGLMYVGSTLR